jgi:hypothetical protein
MMSNSNVWTIVPTLKDRSLRRPDRPKFPLKRGTMSLISISNLIPLPNHILPSKRAKEKRAKKVLAKTGRQHENQ